MTILLVDDEAPILELLSYNMRKEGYDVLLASSGNSALKLAREEAPQGVILDLMLPDMSGLEVCRMLKSDPATRAIPLIMVTALTEEADIVQGLELGADDYITKPFSPRVLSARLRSVLRRCQSEIKAPPPSHRSEQIHTGNLSINVDKFQVHAGNRSVPLSATEFALLLHLARNPGRVFTRRQLINAIKGDSYPVTERSVDVQILSIRKKLSETSEEDSIIETVRGVGYRLREEEEGCAYTT